ncbi:uncharacterized protein PAF06_004679 [Gastrophryne carolinensis]
MYHRGGDRGWHHPRDGPPPRNHVSRPYRGGYHDHREHSSYEQYGYGPCQDRNYNDTKYQENSFHEYQEDHRPYHGYRDSRGQGYYRGARHDNSYQKDFHGGYQQSYSYKKYSYKSHRKEDDSRPRLGTPKPAQTDSIESGLSLQILPVKPFPDGWPDMPSGSAEKADTSTQRHPEPNVKQELTDTAKDLRKAFILARKQEIELAFAQDCRTFAFVANTLLKKDPSMELAVTNALRSALQDIAGRCVQDLRSFVEQYDNVLVNTSNSLQK